MWKVSRISLSYLARWSLEKGTRSFQTLPESQQPDIAERNRVMPSITCSARVTRRRVRAEVRQLDTYGGATWLILNVIYFRPPHRVGRQPLRLTYGKVRLP